MSKILRCAIYTRKSSEEGLQQDFNSLHAQREACEAFIISQKHEGWILHPENYDDGGFSGGNMERPGLKQLLRDIDNKKIDVVVVYKVDRLTRSLADFAKIVEQFDSKNISFVSVTQQFNTTSSMGRLTLNVLLSFAQFEREVTGERIRDKIALSKKKGIWMGGPLALGYDVQDRKLIINEQEAAVVRKIFQRYLELGCVRLLEKELKDCGIRSKARKQESRKIAGFMARGGLYKLLRNRLYLGEIKHKDQHYPGEHKAIIDQELWDQVQNRLNNNKVIRRNKRITIPCFLAKKIFDVSGEMLIPAHTIKRGRRYRYYLSATVNNGTAEKNHGWRLPAAQVERIVAQSAKDILDDKNAIAQAAQAAEVSAHEIPSILQMAALVSKQLELEAYYEEIFEHLIARVELQPKNMTLTLNLAYTTKGKDITITRTVPMQLKRRGIEMKLVIDDIKSTAFQQDLVMIKTIALAHVWSKELLSGKYKSMTEIAMNHGVSPSYVKKFMPLAFLSPSLVETILEGRQPADLTTQKLIRGIDLPLDWREQRQVLGFRP